MPEASYRYRAFISYRHVERDRKWARWLIEKLETFRTPRALVRHGAPLRIGHLFRDDDEIPASSDLSHQIEEALRASQFLIVVCSRDTPHSQWVRREIAFFRSLGRGDRILALLVDGEPSESFPPELLHVPQERVATDGTKTIELVDAEPIAADVRPRKDERTSATERRAFLRIAAGLLGVTFDDLARREHQRRVRQQRLWGSIAAALVLAAGASAYEYWDYNRVKVSYYADIGTRWGVPFGIGELSEETASHRNVSFAVASQRGLVIDVKHVNGSGGLVALDGDGIDAELWNRRIAEWHLPYPSAQAAEIDLIGIGNRQIRVEHYIWQGGNSAVVSYANANGGAQALTGGSIQGFAQADSNLFPRKSAIAQHRLLFDATGLITLRLYQTIWGAPAQDADGSLGRAYTYNAHGQIILYRDLGSTDETLIGKTGIAKIRRHFLESGDLDSVDWLSSAGELVLNEHGYARLTTKRDHRGNLLEVDYFDANGKPTQRNDSDVGRMTNRYDERGNEVEKDYFDPDGLRILRSDNGISCRIAKFDDHGRIIEQDFFGTDMRPILRSDTGIARQIVKFDQRSNDIEEDYFGTDGKPILRNDRGVARITSHYDDRGNGIDEDNFGTDGKPILRKDAGYAHATLKYDGRGEVIERDYFGIDGRPILRKDAGIARTTDKYDDHGNMIEENYFGVDGQPILRKSWGVARITRQYDDRGNEIEEAYFGTYGQPVLHLGAARVTARYDDRGTRIERNYFGTDGKLTNSTAG